MRVRLLNPADAFDWSTPIPAQSDLVMADLDLRTLIHTMAGDDDLLRDVATRGLLRSLTDPGVIRYRQQALRDCLAQPEVVRAMYQIAVEVLATARRQFPSLRSSVDSVLTTAIRTLELFAAALAQLHGIATVSADRFQSEAFRLFFDALAEEVDDAYLSTIEKHLRELTFPRGVLINTRLGPGNTNLELALHRPPEARWVDRLLSADFGREGYSFEVPLRDNGGLEALGELRGRATNQVANAAAQSADHLKGFFTALRAELGFYVAALKLHDRLTGLGCPCSFPDPHVGDETRLTMNGLYDPCLALHLGRAPVGNDLAADGAVLLIITGANEGGKSTFLRSLGIAQLMMQAGLFVPAGSLAASVATGVCTHFKREEDVSMTSGKFDEELARMSDIVARISAGGLLLCNESFSATNEQEGAQIGRDVVEALLDAGIRVVFVTHLFALANAFAQRAKTVLLRAERREDGQRTYRLVLGAPDSTSYGDDAYRLVFGEDLA